jgi:AcrR family transcriptional regulator
VAQRWQALSRERIPVAGMHLVEREGPQALTLRRLGDVLGVDATAVYRHFRDKEDLLSAIGDRTLEGRVVDPGDEVGWREGVRDLCLRLRAAYLAQPAAADVVRAGPPRQGNELLLTEVMLRLLHRAGFSDAGAADAYHSLIGLTLGSAAIDAPVSRRPAAERDELYARWRREYAAMDRERYPVTVDHAHELWPGDAAHRFEVALDTMLDGLEAGLSQQR